jgi:hypothetical protein
MPVSIEQADDVSGDIQEDVVPQEPTQAQDNSEPAVKEPVDDSNSEEVIVSIEGESPTPEDNTAPEWVRSLRKNYRELQREKRELEEKLRSKETVEPNPTILGKKPTLEDLDYDAEKFEVELAKWYDQKREVEEANNKRAEAQLAQQQAWQQKLDTYGKAKADLRVSDYDDAEASVQESFDLTQQGIILQGADNPAILIYALGKNPKKAKELSELKDPVQFAFAMGKLETQLKITSRKTTPPPPDKKVVGNASASSSDDMLEKLRDEAARTGDFTKVVAYKRQLKQSN